MLSDVEYKIVHQISGAKIKRNVEELCRIAPDRFVGTEGDKKAIEYVKACFEELGLEVRETPIHVPSWQETKPPIIRIMATGEELEGISASFAVSTPVGGLTADLVLVRDGKDQDYEGRDVSGKIVVLTEETLGFSKFWMGTYVDRAARNGAVGVILIHPMPWPYRISMEAGNSVIANRFCEKKVPTVCISGIEGLKLMHAIGRGDTKIYFETSNKIEPRDSVVMSAFHQGTEFPEQRIAFVGHRDNANTPGANDNGTGTGTILELARVLSKTAPKRSFEFISSTAEEGVTEGIWQYIETHKEELKKNMKAVLDTDMVGVGGVPIQVDMGHWPDAKPQQHPKWLLEMVEQVAEEMGYGFGRLTCEWGYPEEGRFNAIGVPSTVLWQPDDPYYHSIYDTPDHLNPGSIKAVADTYAIVAWRLANK